MDMTSIQAAGAAFKAISDTVKATVALRDNAMIQVHMAALHEHIMSAQAKALEAQQQIYETQRELDSVRNELLSIKSWDAESERYRLRDFGGQTYAYELQPEKANGEPHHLLCPHCYQQRQKSVLQRTSRHSNQEWFSCHRCSARLPLGAHAVSERSLRSSSAGDYSIWDR